MKCPKCGSKVSVCDTDMWSDYKCTNPECDYYYFEDFEEEKTLDENKEIIHIPKVEEWTITSLRYTCKNNKVKGYTKMSREQLIKEVENIINNIGKKED